MLGAMCRHSPLMLMVLPALSHGREVTSSSMQDYLYVLLGGLILVQTIFLVFLVLENRRHLRAKADTEKQYAEITHAARLALIGEISASIAHEVTQPLSAILSNVETAETMLRSADVDPAPILEILEDVRNDDLRAHGIVRKLRVLLRKRELQFEFVDINALTSSVLALALPDAVRRNVIIRTALDSALPRVPADPVHLQQVLLNLIINAMDSMDEVPSANKWLELRTERCDDEYVQVTVTDNGSGIKPEQKSKLFESFFTTKPEGMGIGLSVARSIIALHGGAIWAENAAGAGASFRFTIPMRTT